MGSGRKLSGFNNCSHHLSPGGVYSIDSFVGAAVFAVGMWA